jgi:hypothetical protein
MADRKQTPNILNDLLGGTPPPKAKHTSIPARQHTGKPASRPASTTAGPQAAEEAKLKATYYLSPGALEALDEAWLSLRKRAKAGDRAKVSKSAIVEQALLLCLGELDKLAKRIA